MSRTPNEIRSYISVDVNNLHSEVVEQVALYDEICKNYSFCVSERDRLKSELKDSDAIELLNIRTQAEQHNTKVTESMVDALIKGTDSHKRLAKVLTEVERDAVEWTTLKDDFKHRADMLGILVNLYTSGYFVRNAGTPSRASYDHARSSIQRRSIT